MPRLLSRFTASILCCLLWSATGASAQSGAAKTLRLPQAERLAIELRQGMTAQEVEKLLGKPRRTTLKADGYSGSREASSGTLQWTYSWSGASEPQRTLQVTFASSAPERWLVSSWDWAGY
jgi:hypothetical protein